jgi:hypothetical protein
VTNPYRPPEAVVRDQDRPRGSPWKAVLFGVLTDIVGTSAASVILSLIWGVVLAAGGASADDIMEAAGNIDPTSAVAMISYVIGAAFSFLGGYVCARVARHDELKWGSIVALISMAFGFAVSSGAQSTELNVLLSILSIVAVMAGAWLGARHNQRG